MSQNRFEQKFTKTESCWLWNAALRSTGYGAFSFQGKCITASRFSYMLYKGDIPVGMHVLHKCDNPRCVNPEHLFLGTNKDNVEDRKSKQRRVGRFKNVTPEQIDLIKPLIECGKLSYREISRQTGIDRSTIWRIANNNY